MWPASPAFRDSLDPVVRDALRRILACVEPERVLLFGSRNGGSVHPDSDLDLIVVAEANHRRQELERELRESLGALAMPVDVLLVTPAELARQRPTSFLATVAATSTVIYAAEKGVNAP